MTRCCGLSSDGQRSLSRPLIISIAVGSQLFGMCGFSLMLFRMCLKINLGVFIYLFVYLFLPLLFTSTADCPDAVPSSAETGGTNYLAPGGLSGETFSLISLAVSRPLEMTGDERNRGGLLPPQLVWN